MSPQEKLYNTKEYGQRRGDRSNKSLRNKTCEKIMKKFSPSFSCLKCKWIKDY